jgi:2-iminobutanoate/2-iminopropanoate deaminase
MGKRKSLHIAGLAAHKNPIPHCVKIGGMLFSGAITGVTESGEIPDSLDEQVGQAFRNLRILLTGAEVSSDDIAKLTVFLSESGDRSALNREWLAMFPDEHDRPVRHTVSADLLGKSLIQLEIIAIL